MFLRISADNNHSSGSETITSTECNTVQKWSHMAKFYTVRITPNQAEGKFMASCEQCKHVKKTYAITEKSVGAIDRHYKSKHIGMLNEYNNQKKRKSPDSGHECSGIEPKKKKQTTIPIYTAMSSSRRSDDKVRESCIINYFIEEMVPFLHIESPAYRNMIWSFDSSYQIMNKKTLTKKNLLDME